MKRLRVLVLVHPDLVPPDSTKGYSEQEINEWKTEYDVVSTLRAAGHEVRPLGVHDELKPIRDEIEGWKPHVVFTLLEQFHGEVIYDQNVASYLELMRIPYTGCNPRGLMLARGKDLSKTLVHYHRIPVPAFAVFPLRRKVRRPTRLALPLIVKSLSEDASWGISQASVVDTDEKLAERVAFIHERIGTAAIAEQYHRGPRALRRRARQRAAAGAAGVGAGIRQHGGRRVADRHREGQARPQLSGAPRHLMGRPRTSRRSYAPASRVWRSGSTGRSARRLCPHRLPASADGTPYFIEVNPNPGSRRARNSRPRPSTTARLSGPAASHRGARHQPGQAPVSA